MRDWLAFALCTNGSFPGQVRLQDLCTKIYETSSADGHKIRHLQGCLILPPTSDLLPERHSKPLRKINQGTVKMGFGLEPFLNEGCGILTFSPIRSLCAVETACGTLVAVLQVAECLSAIIIDSEVGKTVQQEHRCADAMESFLLLKYMVFHTEAVFAANLQKPSNLKRTPTCRKRTCPTPPISWFTFKITLR